MSVWAVKGFSTMLKISVLCVCVLSLASALTCPDSGLCDNSNTCCQTASGVYGWCPLPNAECCGDHLHCCFAGMLCDLEHSHCSNASHTLPWLRRIPAEVPLFPQAWSCLDGGQCCPDGYHLSDDGASCTKNKASYVEAVICPDGESECPDGTTCCQLPDSSWGCCPMAKAVCCEDRKHCCPEGTKCDLEHSKCLYPTQGETIIVKKFPARRRASPEDHGRRAANTPGGKSQYSGGQTPLRRKLTAAPSDVICPDVVSRCPNEMTCCQLSNGSYGCCPMPRAVCCSDFLHCCPDGTKCDLAHSTCVSSGGSSVSWAAKLPAKPAPQAERGNVVPCNDTVACPDNTTCCKMAAEQWACCPFSQAVCCDDHMHCCPHGTICNLVSSTCDTPTSPVPRLDKRQPDDQCNSTASCPGQATCCRTPNGDWACCPLPQAVCCDDHIHCCPHGHTCNVAAGTCDSPSGPVPWREKRPARISEADEKCDEQTVCPSGTTCCRQNSREWACCPLPHAVCCDDHEHCCPKGYKCDVSQKTCNKPGAPGLSWAQKLPAQMKHGAEANVSAPFGGKDKCDPYSSCPKDNTCCYMNKVGRWGCCPLPKAVCCKDGDHCCPNGYQCDQRQESCIRGGLVIGWYRKLEAQSHPITASDVKCDTQSSCPTGTTCCPLSTGQWGCCPLVQAVCCADHEHCCPQGYTCNMKSGTCDKEEGHVIQKVPVRPISGSDPKGAGKADSQCSHCSEGETCCWSSHTSEACCPWPEAVCCSDMTHCCPAGYTCDLEAGSCSRPNQLSWDFLLTRDSRAVTPV
uniref:Granulin b n=1 Tax=Paramormyrops kingsleyae TaxID=1676925 RepID=A0A3B3RP66_9TELE|nr:granulins-like [Paramormyrops kingsleyae]